MICKILWFGAGCNITGGAGCNKTGGAGCNKTGGAGCNITGGAGCNTVQMKKMMIPTVLSCLS